MDLKNEIEIITEEEKVAPIPGRKNKKKKRKRKDHAENNEEAAKNTDISINGEKGENTENAAKTNIEKEPEKYIPKKKKKKEHPATIECDLEQLFSNNGKRPGGTHLTFEDLRTLIMLTINGERFPNYPKWCKIINREKILRTVVIMVGGVSQNEFEKYEKCFTFLNENFNQKLPFRLDGHDLIIKSPLESFLRYKMPKKLQQEKNTKLEQEAATKTEFSDYLLSESQLLSDNFPPCNSSAKEHGIISTRKSNKRKYPKKHSKVLAVDCEMCQTASDSHALTRISIVDDKLQTVYDQLVKPHGEITDYVTQWSGITAAMMEGVTTTLEDVQEHLLTLIQPDTILIGHSLDFDLRALKLHHDNIIDTSSLYIDERGPRYKSSLKFLTKTYLKRDIQNSLSGHCSIEDAKSCMELALLKVEKGCLFGTPGLDQESVYEALTRNLMRGALLDSPTIVKQYSHGNHHSIPCLSDEQVVSKCKHHANDVKYTFAHLKRYENLLKENVNDGDLSCDKIKETLLQLNEDIASIVSSLSSQTLVVVSLSSGFIHPETMKLVRDKETRKCEKVKQAVRKARNGVSFVKIT